MKVATIRVTHHMNDGSFIELAVYDDQLTIDGYTDEGKHTTTRRYTMEQSGEWSQDVGKEHKERGGVLRIENM